MELVKTWFPGKPSRREVEPRLKKFYKENAAYHEMTSSGDKTLHPQVQLLQCLIKRTGTYAEIGCGGGVVCALIGQTAHVYGFDVSELAMMNRKGKSNRNSNNMLLSVASAEQLPLKDNSVDGCYCFEVLEHVWGPIRVAMEMVRITRQGGFILISAPHVFSLDLHLRKRVLVRSVEILFAIIRLFVDRLFCVTHHHIVPDIEGEPYPDCDMITSLVPSRFASFLESVGCHVDFWDTTYMCAHREGSPTNLKFQRNIVHPFFRHFGDHLLILAHKR